MVYKHKDPNMFKFAFLSLLSIFILSTNSYAFEFKTVFEGSKFAVNQVILTQDEQLNDSLKTAIIREAKANQQAKGFYQTSTAVFPANSKGFLGSMNEKLLGVLTLSNYGTPEDSIFFNTNVHVASEGGLYITYDQITTMVDNRSLNPLLDDLYIAHIPLNIINMPVKIKGYDIKHNLYFTAKDNAKLIDLLVLDSAFYKFDDLERVQTDCEVSFLGFIDRMVNEVPVFLSMHGSINYINCSKVKKDTKGVNEDTLKSINNILGN